MMERWRPSLGAIPTEDGVEFRIWAPGHDRLDLVLYGPDAERIAEMTAEEDGFYTARIDSAEAGLRYRYRIDGAAIYPDPLSRAQPDGVHGPSEVVDPRSFRWSDAAWTGVSPEELVIHEIHIGTFTPGGTFDSAIERLETLVDLGVTAVQLMPVSAFPGARNWGYDGVFLFAPASGYGGPDALRRFVDAAHALGLAVFLDVVYNHFGPEGNYLPALTSGRIFTDAHHTPWGAAVNFDGQGSRAVRDLVIENALHWIHEYHIDGLRLDATHEIIDETEPHILRELVGRVRESTRGPRVLLVAEDERNERTLVLPPEEGGYGLDAVWADDFHHQTRRLIAGDDQGYYRNYGGTAADLAATLQRGWFYQGEVYPGTGAPRGSRAEDLPPIRFVHAIQNHDQVGNRAYGGRLNHEVSLRAFRTASALLLVSPYTPLLFMGQEWAASTPFLYFTDHPEELGRLVTAGRREEFRHFDEFVDPQRRAEIPDPQDVETFRRSTLRWEEREAMPHAGVLTLHRELLRLRRHHPALRRRDRAGFAVQAVGDDGLVLRRGATGGPGILLICAFRDRLDISLPEMRGLALRKDLSRLRPLLWTEEERFAGDGSPAPVPDQEGRLELHAPGAILLETGG